MLVMAKSNQQHYGTIKSSNLCAEIIEYSDEKEYAVCNLASLCLPSIIEDGISEFLTNSTHRVKVYSKTNCGYCKMTKTHLKKSRYFLQGDKFR